VGSTNDEARRLAALGSPDGTVVIAGQQTAGRGRMGRAWHSPEAHGVYLSVLLRSEAPVELIGRYALAAAVATCRACRNTAGSAVGIKWPNDVVADGRKLAGILAEVRTAGAGVDLVLGIGINVNHGPADFPAELAAHATSLRILRGGPGIDRVAVAGTLLRALGEEVDAVRRGLWPEIASRFLAYAPRVSGTAVRLVSGERGVTRGLDTTGALKVETAHGVVLVHAGESVAPAED
jgi:BirA family biotin operon repressor/biotin-[acetyl-CoA-carboxylase] ligase